MIGHIRKRGKSWSIVIDLGRDSTGKRRQKWHTVYGTKADAGRELTKLLHQIDVGTYVKPTRLTLAAYLDRWLRDYATSAVSATTLERYDEIVRKHLVPNLGHIFLTKLQPLHVQEYYSAALRNGRRDGKGGLSPQTVLHHHRLLREALQQAVRWQLLTRNPADAVEPPRPPRKEMKALTETQVAQLLLTLKEKRLYMPVLLAVTTGLRRGEILALRWSDIGLENATLAVRRSIEQTATGLAFKEPKTSRSRRTVSLPGLTVEELRSHRVKQAEKRLAFGPAYVNNDLVCCGDDGRPLVPSSVTHSFTAAARQIGLSGVRFHDMRHTHATQLLSLGIHPKVVSERLGHSTVGLTLDVYSHVLPNMQESAARTVDVALKQAMKCSS